MADDQDKREAGGDPPASSVSGAAAPLFSLTIWPNRSLSRRGFRGILLFTGVMLCIPLIPLLGTPVGLALIPFLAGTLLALWFFINRNYRDGDRLREEVEISAKQMIVVRTEVSGRQRRWSANPYWVRTELRPNPRIENYLVLKGGPREIELGAFLSPDERLDLRADIDRALDAARTHADPRFD